MLHYGVKVINPPIRGSIDIKQRKTAIVVEGRINPPIRGSIEQDKALFKDYNHKR